MTGVACAIALLQYGPMATTRTAGRGAPRQSASAPAELLAFANGTTTARRHRVAIRNLLRRRSSSSKPSVPRYFANVHRVQHLLAYAGSAHNGIPEGVGRCQGVGAGRGCA
jgi:hypothetical protein